MRLLYDAKAAAEMLSMSQRRLADLRRAGKITAVEDGRGWKYLHADLEAYAAGLVTYAEVSA